MGRRKKRKAERRQGAKTAGPAAFLHEPDAFEAWLTDNPLPPPDPDEYIMALIADRGTPAAAAVKTCGTCREFVQDAEFGRGRCLHPGSGVFSPWDDTEACAFYAGSKRRYDGATRY
ncbi:MAG: hypothetical protein AB7T37_14495 [Dehalococcoidia bacterium]